MTDAAKTQQQFVGSLSASGSTKALLRGMAVPMWDLKKADIATSAKVYTTSTSGGSVSNYAASSLVGSGS